MNTIETITMTPIGIVRTDVPDDDVPRRRRTLESTIEIFDEYDDGLEGITDYSHVFVLFWMHRCPRPTPLQVHPRGNTALPLTGVFASRGRARPNPIGLAVAELLARDGRRLHVRRLDAYDGTPVLDIKPYDHYDVCSDPRVPRWFAERLQRGGATQPVSGG